MVSLQVLENNIQKHNTNCIKILKAIGGKNKAVSFLKYVCFHEENYFHGNRVQKTSLVHIISDFVKPL